MPGAVELEQPAFLASDRNRSPKSGWTAFAPNLISVDTKTAICGVWSMEHRYYHKPSPPLSLHKGDTSGNPPRCRCPKVREVRLTQKPRSRKEGAVGVLDKYNEAIQDSNPMEHQTLHRMCHYVSNTSLAKGVFLLFIKVERWSLDVVNQVTCSSCNRFASSPQRLSPISCRTIKRRGTWAGWFHSGRWLYSGTLQHHILIHHRKTVAGSSGDVDFCVRHRLDLVLIVAISMYSKQISRKGGQMKSPALI